MPPTDRVAGSARAGPGGRLPLFQGRRAASAEKMIEIEVLTPRVDPANITEPPGSRGGGGPKGPGSRRSFSSEPKKSGLTDRRPGGILVPRWAGAISFHPSFENWIRARRHRLRATGKPSGAFLERHRSSLHAAGGVFVGCPYPGQAGAGSRPWFLEN